MGKLRKKCNNFSNPFDYFDAIYCINLDRRSDRWKAVQKEFEKVGILDRVVRFSAIETPENGHIGCLLSHRSIIQKAKDMEWKNVLVFEDDIKIYGEKSSFNNYIGQVQKVTIWNLMYFGGVLLHGDIPIMKFLKGNLISIKGIRGTYAIAYHSNIFDILLKNWEEPINFVKKNIAFDRHLSRSFQKKNTCLLYDQILLGVDLNFSDTSKVFRNSNGAYIDNFYFWKVLNKIKYLSFILQISRSQILKFVNFYKNIIRHGANQ